MSHRSLGPWSTSLDSGWRVSLSPFWKRRMAALGRLSHQPWRLRRRSVALALAMMSAVTFAPLWRLSAEKALADEATAEPTVGAAAPGDGAFVARFSGGVEVELIGVSFNPSKGQLWWQPNGSVLPKAPYAEAAPHMKNGPMSREFCWQWRGVDESEIKTSWDVAGVQTFGWGPGRPVDDTGKELTHLTAYAVPMEEAETCDLVFTVDRPVSKWSHYDTFEAGHVSTSVFHPPGFAATGVTFDKPRQLEEGAFVTIGYMFPEDREVRLKAIDHSGKTHVGKGEFAGSMNGFRQLAVTFPKVKAREIAKWIVETRRRSRETKIFRNVSLHPGKLTKVDIGGPETAATAGAKGIEFEAPIERVINDDNPERGDFLIDFDSGEVLSPPADVDDASEMFSWVASKGIDASGELSSGVQGLLGFDMIALPTAEFNWNPSPRIFAQVDDGKPGTPAVMSGRGELPVTYMFKTREGRRGVLQILERNGHDSVKIRYKLEKRGS
jgi:hypothetical protein